MRLNMVLCTATLFVAACSESESSTPAVQDTTGSSDLGGADGTDSADGAPDVAAPKDTAAPKDIQISAPDLGSTEDVVAAPAASCREAVTCQYGCSLADVACRTACADGAAETVTGPLGTLNACLETNCKAETSESVSQCWLDKENCYDEFASCFFGGKSGAVNCEDTSKCYAACKDSKYAGLWSFDDPSLDRACEDGCLAAADPESQYRFLTWALCVAQFCNANESLGEDCEKNAPCGTQRDLCISPQ